MIGKLFIIIFVISLLLSLPGAGSARDEERCAACGKVLSGPIFETQGARYHENCFLCDYCRQPIKGSYVEYRGKNYHDFCFQSHIALRCVVCGEIIRGRYLLDYWGNACHPDHLQTVARCDFCRRFLAGACTEGMVKLGDGRMLCGICAPSSVTSEGKARVLMRDVSRELARHGITVQTSGIDIRLVGEPQLRSIAGTDNSDTKGYVDYQVDKNLFGTVTRRRVTIYILAGMPRVQAAGTLAHELMHVWQFMQGRLHVEKALSEGSANFAASLVLSSIGGVEATYSIDMMRQDPDPVYGGGFRRVQSFVDREGITAWLDLLRGDKPMVSSF